MTGDNKTHPSTNRTLDVTAVGCDDGFDAGAKALACFENVGCFQTVLRCYDASLQRLNLGVMGDLGLTPQNALNAVIERVEIGGLRRPHLVSPHVIWPAQISCQLGLDGGGVVGGRVVLLEYEFSLRVDHLDPRDDAPVQELAADQPVDLFVRVDEDGKTFLPVRTDDTHNKHLLRVLFDGVQSNPGILFVTNRLVGLVGHWIFAFTR